MRVSVCRFFSLVLVLLLAACASNQPLKERYGNYKVGNPYRVEGELYVPKIQPGYDEVGIASWYGPGFHRAKTANGAKYDQHDLTAAHKTLPLPSVVRVTNLDNGKSTEMVVSDRGPFVRGRIIDVSRKGAEKLGFLGKGTAKVRVQVLEAETEQLLAQLEEESGASGKAKGKGLLPGVLGKGSAVASKAAGSVLMNTARASSGGGSSEGSSSASSEPSSYQVASASDAVDAPVQSSSLAPSPALKALPSSQSYFVQAGSFTSKPFAENFQNRLESIGAARTEEVQLNNQTYYRVKLGPLSSKQDAQLALEKLQARGHKDARIVGP